MTDKKKTAAGADNTGGDKQRNVESLLSVYHRLSQKSRTN